MWNADEIYRPIHERIQAIVKAIDANEEEWMKRPSPYTHGTPDPVYKMTLKDHLFRLLPATFQKAWALQKREKRLENTKYIF